MDLTNVKVAALSAALIFSHRVAKASNLSQFELFILKNAARLPTLVTFTLIASDILEIAGVDEEYKMVENHETENCESNK